jgi:protocatechuate 3,4-dioxygenase beta subunit
MKFANDAHMPLSRRRAIRALGLLGSAPLLSCAADGLTDPAAGAILSNLSLSAASLSPDFTPATTSYTASVPYATAETTVTATAADSEATITVNGVGVTSGAASGRIGLAVGNTTITIVVTAPSGATMVYAITAVRAATMATSCVVIPQETDGPYPLYSVLGNSAMVRSDIREGKSGVPLTLILTAVNTNQDCAPIANAAVYIWHCDKDGQYSGYSNSANGNHLGETFLRGIQVTDANGQVAFTTIYPGWYTGRITHIHFEVFLNNNLNATAKATSQIAFPQAVTQAVYSSSPYAARGQNTSVSGFAADNVFSDGETYQLANVAGDVASGYVAMLTVGVAA